MRPGVLPEFLHRCDARFARLRPAFAYDEVTHPRSHAMAEYKAKEGQEDRHGEMTGAISINMMMSMLPLTIWCFFISPLLFESIGVRIAVALVAAVVVPLAFIRPSRWVWAHISEFMENDSMNRQG